MILALESAIVEQGSSQTLFCTLPHVTDFLIKRLTTEYKILFFPCFCCCF